MKCPPYHAIANWILEAWEEIRSIWNCVLWILQQCFKESEPCKAGKFFFQSKLSILTEKVFILLKLTKVMLQYLHLSFLCWFGSWWGWRYWHHVIGIRRVYLFDIGYYKSCYLLYCQGSKGRKFMKILFFVFVCTKFFNKCPCWINTTCQQLSAPG